MEVLEFTAQQQLVLESEENFIKGFVKEKTKTGDLLVNGQNLRIEKWPEEYYCLALESRFPVIPFLLSDVFCIVKQGNKYLLISVMKNQLEGEALSMGECIELCLDLYGVREGLAPIKKSKGEQFILGKFTTALKTFLSKGNNG